MATNWDFQKKLFSESCAEEINELSRTHKKELNAERERERE